MIATVAARAAYSPWLSLALTASLLSGCSSDKGDKEPTVTVQVAPVEKTTIQHTITTQAILFPHAAGRDRSQDQRSGAEISGEARQPRCTKDELLAVLENRDLDRRRAGHQGRLRSGPGQLTKPPPPPACRKKSRRPKPTRSRPNRRSSARRRCLPEPPATFRTGRVAAKRTRPVARRHHSGAQSICNRQEASRCADADRQATGTQIRRGTTGIGQRKISGRAGATQLLRNPQPDRWRRHRPPALSRRNGRGRHAPAHGHGYFFRHRQGAHSAERGRCI